MLQKIRQVVDNARVCGTLPRLIICGVVIAMAAGDITAHVIKIIVGKIVF